MKREILFRGQTIDGIWVFGDLIHIGGGALIYHGDNQELETIPQEDSPCAVGFYPNEISVVIPKTVGQFTWLTDKNGKMIFEGDVLKIDTRLVNLYTNEVVENSDHTDYFTVLFNSDLEYNCFQLEKIKTTRKNNFGVGTTTNYFIYNYTSKSEIIGNIHDNHELS